MFTITLGNNTHNHQHILIEEVVPNGTRMFSTGEHVIYKGLGARKPTLEEYAKYRVAIELLRGDTHYQEGLHFHAEHTTYGSWKAPKPRLSVFFW
jgi:hypothetical protein